MTTLSYYWSLLISFVPSFICPLLIRFSLMFIEFSTVNTLVYVGLVSYPRGVSLNV